MIFSMGYGTNAKFCNTLLDSKCLVISDELNHTSIRTGVRLSGATVKTFKHGSMEALEKIIGNRLFLVDQGPIVRGRKSSYVLRDCTLWRELSVMQTR